MAKMYDNDKSPSRYFSESFQLTNWILDSGATCHMTPQVSYFIPGSLEYTDEHSGVGGGHHVTENQKGQV